MRLRLRQVMENEGYRVAEAENGDQGLAAYERLNPDLVILDGLMPGMDGITCCVQLCCLSAPNTRLPILMIAALDDPESVDRAFAAGATDCITKPIHQALLRQRVRQLLQRTQIHQQLEQSNQELQARVEELGRMQQALRESEERYALAALGANDGLWDWNLLTNQIYFSPRWKSMSGLIVPESDSSIEVWFNQVHPEDIERVKAAIASHLQGLTPHLEIEYRLQQQSGAYRWMLCRGLAVRNLQDSPYRLAGSQTDITERRLVEAELWHQAFHDALTGLPNRFLFSQRLEQLLEQAKWQKDYLFAVLFLDLDRFKVLNDSLGHLQGDQLLKAIARRLEKCLRPGDTVSRMGGDEFMVLLEQIADATDANRMAERIQQELKLPFNLGGQEICIDVSIGVAISDGNYHRSEDLLRDAEVTMYRAKALGGGHYEVFTPSIHTQAMARLQLETDLRQALNQQELQLYYQPIVSLKTGHLIGFEALVRWQHLQRGIISPTEFIPIAEETGLIIPIGLWVLSEACHQMHAWQQQFPNPVPLKISVNLSGRQLLQPQLVAQVKQILQSSQLHPQSLKLEITESVMMENIELTTKVLQQLQALGIQLCMDDFGTGYSSLSYLHRLPIDTLKIDRSFTNDIDNDPEKIEIIRTVVALAWNLGLDVIAEGVETKTQMFQLQALRCDYGQGYFFSKPLDAEAARALIKIDLQPDKTNLIYPENLLSRQQVRSSVPAI